MRFSLYNSFSILLLFLMFTFISCSKDSDDPLPLEKTITTSDFSVSIDENPEHGKLIGTVSGSTNEGTLSFSVVEQSPEDAFSIDATTGDLKVADPDLFNFEIYPILTGTVKVANGTLFEIATVTINLNDVEEYRAFEGDVYLKSQSEIIDFGTAGYTHILGDLIIGNTYSNDINDLLPLLNLEYVDASIIIFNCSRLTSTDGLKNLSYIGNLLSIEGNPRLERITDLPHIKDLETLSLWDNYSLNDISGLEPLKVVRQNLKLSASKLTNLNVLSNLNTIGDHLTIVYNQNLTDINGLINLSSVNDIYIGNNDLLQNLNGLSNLAGTVSSLTIYNNAAIENLDGLQNIEITDKIRISYNFSLKSIEGLSNTKNINGLEISDNNSLIDLQGLSSLNIIGESGLIIKKNIRLENLNGLSEISRIDGSLSIEHNVALRDFCGLTDFLNNGSPGSYTVLRNFYNPTVQDILDGNCSI